MIESITLKKVASYDETGVQIIGLKKLNFFFGRNGSGKSTIAKYLYKLATGTNNSPSHCSHFGFNPAEHKILVFDEEFTSRNFIKNRTQKGVFSLNEKNEEIDNKISKLEKRITRERTYLETIKTRVSKVNENKGKLERRIKQWCFEKRDQFKAFSNFQLKHPGSKDNHLRELRYYLEESSTPKSFEELKSTYRTIYEKDLTRIEHKIEASDYRKIRKLETDINAILGEVITGNTEVDIADMIDQLGIKQWVEQGIEHYHKNDDPSKCPFCQKPSIDDELIEKFEMYFDQVYKEKIQTIQALKERYTAATNNLIRSIERLKDEFDESGNTSVLLTNLKTHFEKSNKTIEDKIEFSNEIKRIDSICDWKGKMSAISKAIEKSNILFDSLTERQKQFEKDIWIYLSKECSTEIGKFDARLGKSERIGQLGKDLSERSNGNIRKWEKEIASLKEETVTTKTAVERINKILVNSGFSGFEIKEREDKQNNISQYFIKRNTDDSDHVFPTLSEGEKNFISFLYFYQLCLGTDDLDEGGLKKIIVIDDPVSSLDSQVLFIVNTLIHQLITRRTKAPQEFENKSIQQVFILTHNIYFYKEVSLDKRPICKNKKHFHVNKSGFSSIEEVATDDLLFDDYSLLWMALKGLKENKSGDRTVNILIANNMRRIIESYVHFNGLGKSAWVSIDEMDKESSEYILCSSFLSAINDSSHKSSPLDDFYYQRIVSQTPESLFFAFEKIFSEIGKDHYRLMMAE